jgi:hypothetical protein
MTPLQDYFVGFVATAFGCFLILGAALNLPWLMQLKHAALLTNSIGKSASRWLLGCLGVIVVAMGLLIAAGWQIDWSGGHHDAASSAPAARGS